MYMRGFYITVQEVKYNHSVTHILHVIDIGVGRQDRLRFIYNLQAIGTASENSQPDFLAPSLPAWTKAIVHLFIYVIERINIPLVRAACECLVTLFFLCLKLTRSQPT